AHGVLHVSRDRTMGLINLATANYPVLKSWYDAVALSDQHNLILVQNPEPAPAAKSAGPP
ncbi:MAG: hypothetical protein ACHQ5A_12660, partial [Opitutales bacterium]